MEREKLGAKRRKKCHIIFSSAWMSYGGSVWPRPIGPLVLHIHITECIIAQSTRSICKKIVVKLELLPFFQLLSLFQRNGKTKTKNSSGRLFLHCLSLQQLSELEKGKIVRGPYFLAFQLLLIHFLVFVLWSKCVLSLVECLGDMCKCILEQEQCLRGMCRIHSICFYVNKNRKSQK